MIKEIEKGIENRSNIFNNVISFVKKYLKLSASKMNWLTNFVKPKLKAINPKYLKKKISGLNARLVVK